MATVRVQISFKNRIYPKIFELGDDATDFDTIKNAVKATGAKFDSTTRRWIMKSKAEMETLGFQVKRWDFSCNASSLVVTLTADKTERPLYIAKDWNDMVDMRDKLQEAYNESDEAFKSFYQKVQNVA
jgi:hypothetical protein